MKAYSKGFKDWYKYRYHYTTPFHHNGLVQFTMLYICYGRLNFSWSLSKFNSSRYTITISLVIISIDFYLESKNKADKRFNKYKL